MSKRKLQKAYKHNRKRYPCGCCDSIKADHKYRTKSWKVVFNWLDPKQTSLFR